MIFRYPYNVEFGIHMIGSTLLPFYAKAQNIVDYISIECRYKLPEEIWKQFCNSFSIISEKADPIIPVCLDYKSDCFKMSLNMPKYNRPFKEKYIAILPVFSEFYHSCGYRATCSLRSKDWQKIKTFANQSGYKIIMLGLEPDMGIYNRLGKKQDYIGNETAYADLIIHASKDQYPNGFIEKQLPYIANAELTIATGGSSCIPLMFGCNSILMDNGFSGKYKTYNEEILDHYSCICSSVIKYHEQITSIPFRKDITNRLDYESTSREYESSKDQIIEAMKKKF